MSNTKKKTSSSKTTQKKSMTGRKSSIISGPVLTGRSRRV